MSDDAWTLILAAGAGSRFGGSKPLAPWGDSTLLAHAIATAHAVTPDRVMVVLGSGQNEIERLAKAHWTVNHNWRHGMGQSIATGVEAICRTDPAAAIIVILPVDQPLVTFDHMHRLISTCRNLKRPVLTADKDITGPPAAFPENDFQILQQLTGDRGFKQVLKNRQVEKVLDRFALLDADTPEQLQMLATQLPAVSTTGPE